MLARADESQSDLPVDVQPALAVDVQPALAVDVQPALAVETPTDVPLGELLEPVPGSEDALVTYPAAPELPRHVDVRRALLSGEDLDSASARERRRLTAEERSALRLELRRAVRNAYQDGPTR